MTSIKFVLHSYAESTYAKISNAVGLSSSTPASPTTAGFAGTANTAARGDHSHPLPAAHGGQYSSPATVMSTGSVNYVTLSTVSGESAAISGGNIVIPSGAGGVWSFSATWKAGNPSSGRMFMDIDLNGGAGIYRSSLVGTEDRITGTTIMAVVPGDVIKVGVFASGGTYNSEVILNAYRLTL